MQVVRLQKLVKEARLPHTRFADDCDYLTAPMSRVLRSTAQMFDFQIASDEAAQPARPRHLQSRPRCTGSSQLEDLDRLCEALHWYRSDMLHLDVAISQRERIGGEPDRSRGRQLLHPRSEMCGLADRRVIHAHVASDCAHHNLAGIKADPNLHLDPVHGAQPVGVLPNGFLHAQRCVTGPHRVVFVGERRPEQRHDSVTQHLVDGAFVVVHRLHHPLEHWIKQFARVLGIPVGEQFHGALDVSEQHRHLFTLALERLPRLEDPLGKVARRDNNRGAVICNRPAKRCAAVAAELVGWKVRRSACRAPGNKAHATLPAESGTWPVLMPALGANHDHVPRRSGTRQLFWWL